MEVDSLERKQELHRLQHVEWHAILDALLADFIGSTGRLLSKTSAMELLEWSHQQTLEKN